MTSSPSGTCSTLARKAVSKTQGISREAYNADENLHLAVIHLIQTIGEAARQVRGRRVLPRSCRTTAPGGTSPASLPPAILLMIGAGAGLRTRTGR